MQTLGNGGFIMTNLQIKKMIAECEKNAPKVETKGILPRRCNPTAMPTMFCSAIKH